MQMTRPKPAFTKERLYLEHAMGHGMSTVVRHINRYKWATSHCRKLDTALNAGCGSGYGDYILLNACQSVVGVDISEEAVTYAKWKAARQRQPRLRYERQNLACLTLPETFNVVVCIEVIEHLKEADQYAFMGTMKHLLKGGGRLLMTTPVKEADGHTMTDFHEREFDKKEFEEFLHEFFSNVQFDSPARFKIPENFMLAVCDGVIR